MVTQLQWERYQDIAGRFEHKARPEDREDLRQEIVLRLAEVEANNGHNPFTLPAMLRVASYTVLTYWRDQKRKPTILSINSDIEDDDGNATELYQTIADDKAIDLEAWLDAKWWLLGCPRRLISIARKRADGVPLNGKDQDYLDHYRQKEYRRNQLQFAVF